MVHVPYSRIFLGRNYWQINVWSSGSFVGTTSLQLSHTYPTHANVFTHNYKAAKFIATLLNEVHFYLQISQIRPINMYLSCIHTVIVPETRAKVYYRPQYTVLILTCRNRKCLSHLQPYWEVQRSQVIRTPLLWFELISHKTHLNLDVGICSGLKQFLDYRMVIVDGGTDQSCVSIL